MADPSGTTRYPTVAATSAATAPYDDDDWLTPDNAKADDAAAAISHYTDSNTATTGVNDTVVTVASGGTIDWDTKTGVNASGGSAATITNASFDSNVISYLAKGQGLGFAVPSGATILGVTVMVRKNRTAGTTAVDYTIQLLDASGALFGSNKADTATNWPASFSNISYGGAADMWGLTTAQLTPTVVNNANFGVGIQAQAKSNNVDIGVDQITITVYYRLPDLDNAQYSYLLKLSNFAWDIPVGATIDGIKVEIERQGVGTVKDAIVKLLDASGTPVGDSKADTGTAWPSTYGVATYGGAADTWNATPTPTMVNDVDFGVEVAILSSANVSDGQIDYVRMTIYYTAVAEYTLTCDYATIGLTGQTTALKADLKLTAAQATVDLTGQDVTLIRATPYSIIADTAFVYINGFVLSDDADSELTDDADVLLGESEPPTYLKLAAKVIADQASVAITGFDATLAVAKGYTLTADTATVSITQQGVTFTKVLTMIATQASVAATGQVTHLPNIAVKWWESGSIVGLNVYAYQAHNIDSLASSHKNLHDHNDHALTGEAPSWLQSEGWTFNKTTYLATGLIPATTWSHFFRFAGVTTPDAGAAFGCEKGAQVLAIYPKNGSYHVVINGTNWYQNLTPALTSGNLGISDTKAYLNGALDVVITSNLSIDRDIYIGGMNNGGALAVPFAGKINAIIFLDGTIHEEQAYSLYAAMLLLEHRPLLLGEQSSISITDQGVTFTKAVTLTADTATVSITGIDATLSVAKSYSLIVDTATISITGQTTGLLSALKLTATQASVAITEEGATLKIALKLIADQATVSITDQGATLRVAYSYKLTADQASITISGQTAALKSALKLTASQGNVSITGQDISLTFHDEPQPYTLTADQASISITGIDAGLTVETAGHFSIGCTVASFTITSENVSLKIALHLTATYNSVAITSIATNLLKGLHLTAQQTTVALTPQTALLKSALHMTATQASMLIADNPVAFILACKLAATYGVINISGIPANLVYSSITGDLMGAKNYHTPSFGFRSMRG